MTNTEERRYTSGVVELRTSGNNRNIEGYAALFGRESRNLGGFKERVDPSFFNKSKGDGWPGVKARMEHDDRFILGTTNSGALKLNIDGIGLRYNVEPPDGFPPHMLSLIERGDITQSSFAFRAFEEDWGTNEDGFPLRTLVSGKLIDVAPVSDPAYIDTSVGLAALAQRCNADLAEVRSMAANNELKKLLVKSGTVIDLAEKPKVWGRAALVALASKADSHSG